MGRQVELDRAVAHCRAGGVLLAGPSGVGKTRLATEVIAAAAPSHLVQVRATRVSSSMPLGAFAQVLAASGGVEGDAAQLKDAATQLLDGLADDEQLLVSVDDVHLLDDTSATLLLHLAMSGRADLLLTLRSGEEVPEPVTLLWRDELVARMDVSPLDNDAMATLLDQVLPGGVDGMVASTLVGSSGGNLLYLRELVTGLRDSGVLTRSHGHWTLTGPVTPPPRLSELIEQRLASLGEPARRLLDAVALGEPLGIHSLETSGQWELAQELLDAGLVDYVEHGRRRQLRAKHPLHVEVARSTMSEPYRRTTLDGLAEALEQVGCRRRDDARRLATWRLDAGRPADPQVLVDAAREALWGTDVAMCERFSRTVLEVDGLAGEVRLAAAHLLGAALDQQGRFVEAEQVLAAHEPTAGDGRDRTMLALERSANLFRGLGREDDALRVLSVAESEVQDPELLEELLAMRASFAVFAGRVDDTLTLVAPLLEGAGDRAFCEGALQASVAHTLAGRTATAMTIAVRAFETRIQLGDQVQLADPGIHLVALAMAQLDHGLLDEGHRTASAAYDGAVALGDRHGQAWLATILARAHLLSGRLGDATRLAREAAVVFGDLRHPGTRWGFGALALSAGHLGDAVLAATAIEDLDAEPATPVSIVDVEVDRGRAWALVAAGRRSAARDLLGDAAERARAKGQHSLEAGALHDVARIGDATSVVSRLTELAAFVEGPLTAARDGHVRALAADDGDQLDAASEAFVVMGARLFAAEAATSAAAAHRRAGAERRAAASEQTARRLAAECQGASTPALRGGGAADPLTRREHEVAGLAVLGHTNREIADHLVVSVRTVENHLQRVYAKLGVTSRDELGPAMGPVG